MTTYSANSQPTSISGLGFLLISEEQHYCDEKFLDNPHCQGFADTRVKCGVS